MAATTPRYRPLGALVLLSLLLTLTLLTPPSHAVTSAARDDSESSLSVRVVINQDDTYDMTVIGQLKSKSSSDKRGMKENCNPSDAGGPFEDLKASYSERNGLPTCTLTGKSIGLSEVDGFIKHKDDEYTLDTQKGQFPSSSAYGIDYKFSVTFPGEVTDADGGKVSGNTVTFTKPGRYRVSGKDAPAFPWMWVIVGVVLVGAIGAGLFWFLNRKKKAQQQAYAVATAGYAPQQPYAPGQIPAPGAAPPPPPPTPTVSTPRSTGATTTPSCSAPSPPACPRRSSTTRG